MADSADDLPALSSACAWLDHGTGDLGWLVWSPIVELTALVGA